MPIENLDNYIPSLTGDEQFADNKAINLTVPPPVELGIGAAISNLGADYGKVRITQNDRLGKHLGEKLIAGNNVTLTQEDDGTDVESIRISVPPPVELGIGAAISNLGADYGKVRITAGNNVTLTQEEDGNGVQSIKIDMKPIPRVSTIVGSATPTPNADTTDMYVITALAATATFGAPTGTPVDGQKLMLRIVDNGTAWALSWNQVYSAVGITLPTTTTAGKCTYVDMIYNAQFSTWDCISTATRS
jgi:hypothetical protein